MLKRNYLILLVLLTVACGTQNKTAITVQQSNVVVDGKIFTSVFQQQAAEYKALCLQAYNIAKLRLDEALQQPGIKPMAIITDIDETVLDNSPYAAKLALAGKSYDQLSWSDWTARALCDTLPGSFSFFKYASSMNVEIFYITNRLEEERSGTLKNLQQFGFPNADDAHLFLKEKNSSKEERRQKVLAKYEIIMLLGDNLADFSALYDKKTTTERNNVTMQNSFEFGKNFIVLPNCNYGDWEGAIYNYNYGLMPMQKDSIMKRVLKGY